MLVREMKAFTKGFSLVELMVTVAVLAVITAIAIPSFSEMLDSSKRASVAGELAADFALARTEAARRGKRVTVCVSSDGATCSSSTSTDWKSGWIVFSDVAADGVLTTADGDELLRRRDALSGGLSFVSSGFTTTGRVQFRPSGAADSGGALLLCKPGKSGANGRQISLSFSGAVIRTTGVTCP
jgi:type IV fimbrial biogenesis protein FimT